MMATIWALLLLIVAIVVAAINGRWDVAHTLGSLPFTLMVAALGFGVDVWLAKRHL